MVCDESEGLLEAGWVIFSGETGGEGGGGIKFL